jgi:hypothetical protein
MAKAAAPYLHPQLSSTQVQQLGADGQPIGPKLVLVEMRVETATITQAGLEHSPKQLQAFRDVARQRVLGHRRQLRTHPRLRERTGRGSPNCTADSCTVPPDPPGPDVQRCAASSTTLLCDGGLSLPPWTFLTQSLCTLRVRRRRRVTRHSLPGGRYGFTWAGLARLTVDGHGHGRAGA